jgi:hypothetical protein
MKKTVDSLLAVGLIMVAGCAADEEASNVDGGVDVDVDGSSTGAAGGQETDGQGTGGSGQDGAGGTGGIGDAPVIPDQLGVTDPDWTVPEELMLCGDRPCECADGIDNDGDGAADGFDLECSGPLDDDEGSFSTGIPGDNRDPKWQDCFFDGDSGGGNDGCRYSTDCLTGVLDQDHPDCQLSQYCIEYCLPRTPNGCDCFGCCEVLLDDGTTVHVIIGDDCTEENLDECQTCVPTDDCTNECGECELCLGKTIEDLPDYCFTDDGTPPGGGGTGGSGSGGTSGGAGTGGSSSGDGDSGSGGSSSGGGTSGTGGSSGGSGVPFTCDNGMQVCLNTASCPVGYYCLQGCCMEIVE